MLKDFKLMCYQEPSFLKILFRLKSTVKLMIFTEKEMNNLKCKFTFYFTHPKLAETRGNPKNAIKTYRNNNNNNNYISNGTSSSSTNSANRIRGESLNTTNILLETEQNDSVALHSPPDLQLNFTNSNVSNNNNNSNRSNISIHTLDDDDVIPTENCLQYLYRHLISYSPPPYSYDYGLENPQYKDLEEIILVVKQLYGYSVRVTDQRQLGRAIKNYLKNI